MPTAALLENATSEALRLCSGCRWSRNKDGDLYTVEDMAYCGSPDVFSDDGRPVPCPKHRFAKASNVMQICGEEGIFWEPRE